MANPNPTFPSDWADLSVEWQSSAIQQLQAEEQILAWFAPDLDNHLRFAGGLVLLTNKRLLSHAALSLKVGNSNASIDVSPPISNTVNSNGWSEFRLAPGLDLKASEYSGLGNVELTSRDGRLSFWRYTGSRAPQANRLVTRFRMTIAALEAPQASEISIAPSICPKCGGILGPDGECKACAPALQLPPVESLNRLTRFAKPRARLIFIGFLLLLASTCAGLVTPKILMDLVDKVIVPLEVEGVGAWNPSLTMWYLGWMFGSSTLAWILAWIRNYVLSYVSEQIGADLRNSTYSHLQKLSLEFFGGQRTGDLITRVSSDTDRISSFLSSNALDFCADILMIILTAAILLWLNPLLALVSLAPLLPISWVVQQVRNRLRHSYARGMTAWSEMVNVLADTIPGIRVVKAFAQESREIERFRRTNDWVVAANNRSNRFSSLLVPTVTFLTECGTLVIWASGVWLVYRHSENAAAGVTIGTLTGFTVYSARFYARLESMSHFIAQLQRTAASAHRIFEILDRAPSVPEAKNPVRPGPIRGGVEIRNARFRYGKREVIHGVNLKIEPGEMIGLVGPSGAGKSTLVNLICRFYDVAEGAILLDGHDIRSLPVEEFRANVGIVLQEPFLFFGSIAENIAYGRPNASRREIIAAAKAAHAHEFILRLTDGYDSLVGERGQALSGGERQRISIARALLTDPRILILDEATSSLDSETEREIQAALDVLVRGRTTIAIAHRLSTLRKADRLVVVEAGKIVEIGSHDELVHKGGTYTRLHQAQMALAQQIGIG